MRFLVALLLTSCLADSTRCGDLYCPTDKICAPAAQICVSPVQIAACTGLSDGDPCIADGNGHCYGGACTIPICGNGVTEPGEACDDGNNIGGDGCSADCRSTEQCGNGIQDLNEACDCGMTTPAPKGCNGPNSDDPSATCDTRCHLHGCGDGAIGNGEQCDGTNLNGQTCASLSHYGGTLACGTFCQFDFSQCTGSCGDGIVNGPELCEGSGPIPESCLDVGYDAGHTSCNSGTCNADTSRCWHIGYRHISGPAQITRLSGTAIDDLYALLVSTNGTVSIQHYDGVGWTALPSPGFDAQGIWSSSGVVWAVGAAGSMARYNGSWTTLTASTTLDFHAVWGNALDDVFVVGQNGVIVHFDGTSTTVTNTTEGDPLYTVYGRAKNDVWAGGVGGLWHYDGSTWTYDSVLATVINVWVPPTGPQVFAVAGTTLSWYDGTSWNSYGGNFSGSLWGTSASDVYAAANLGKDLFHFDGTSWSSFSLRGRFADGAAIGGAGPRDIWLGGADGLLRYQGANWEQQTAPITGTASMFAVGSDLFIANSNSIVLRSSGSFGTAQTLGGGLTAVTGIWASSTSDAYAGSANVLYHSPDGSTWNVVSSTVNATCIFGFSSAGNDTLYLGGPSSWIYRAGSFSNLSSINHYTYGVWGSAANDVYFVGDGGFIFHSDGTTNPTVAVQPVTTSLAAVWGTGASDVFVVGASGTILHYDGMNWSLMNSGTTTDLVTVGGLAGNDVFAAGVGGVLLHYDGTDWTPMRVPTATDLISIKTGNGVVYVLDGTGNVFTLDRPNLPWP
jgi:cysteine-rich repeat protein